MAVVVPYVIMAVVSVAVSFVMTTAMKKTIEGPKVGDIANQTSKEGGPRTIVWGIVRPIGGNIVACSDPNVVRGSSGGGKGGGGGGQTTESVYRTYAIGICEGPANVRRVWRNNKIVYDAREGNEWGIANNPTFLQKATFYIGAFDQLPDPTLESIFGVGDVPAMRGTCYMVMNNEDLTELGGALPQYIFEVGRAEGVYATSKPYPLEVGPESLESTGFNLVSGEFRHVINTYDDGLPESLTTTDLAIVSGDFRKILHSYEYQEDIVTIDFEITSGIFRKAIHSYTDGIPEELSTIDFEIVSGVFRKALITYDDGLPESLNTTSFSIVEGTHGS